MSTVLAHAAYHLELIDGREIEKPLPKELHAIIQGYLQVVLASILARAKFRILPELNVLCGPNREDRLVPDITVLARNATFRDDDLLDRA